MCEVLDNSSHLYLKFALKIFSSDFYNQSTIIKNLKTISHVLFESLVTGSIFKRLFFFYKR